MIYTEPLQLIQEEHLDDPWRVLLACILLNQTRVEQVRPMMDALLHEWPNAAAMASAPVEDVESFIAAIGLKKRGGYIVEMSASYVKQRPSTWKDVLELDGCGRYAAETWRMLIDKDRTFIPKDMRLRARMLFWRLGECEVIIDEAAHVAIALPGNERGLPIIALNENMSPGYWRDIIIIAPADRRHWKALYGYTVAGTAERWLSSKSIGLTQRATEAVMLLVLSEKNKFVGKFADGSEETIATAAPAGAVTYANVEALKALDIKALLVAFNGIVAPDDRIKKFADGTTVDSAADMVWGAAEAKCVKVKEEKPAREPGDKEKLRAQIVAAGDKGMSIDEMAASLGQEKKRCSDYICYLKNPKYCGEHGVLNIVKQSGRFFATAENAAAYLAANPAPAPVAKEEGTASA